MEFRHLAERMRAIESTSSRLEMAASLAEVLAEATDDELGPIAHMLLGNLAPDHEGLEVGLAEKMVHVLIERLTGADKDRIRELAAETGDLGTVAEQLLEAPRGGQVALDAFGAGPTESARHDVIEVHETLVAIARIEGTGSQQAKMARAWRLLDRTSPLEARYLVRFLVGKLRLGVADMTLIDGAAIALAPGDDVEVDDKDGHPRPPAAFRAALERAYNLTSELGRVLRVARNDGLEGLEAVHITPGSPVRPMLAERLTSAGEILEKVGTPALAEFKYDGLRVQAHLTHDEAWVFSRRLEAVTAQFPDVIGALRQAFGDHDVVVEGEAVPVDPETGRIRPFQHISRRRGRKHDLQRAIEQIPIRTYLFELLYLDGEDLTVTSLDERRARLGELLPEDGPVRVSDGREVQDPADLDTFFDDAVTRGAEGIMVKALGEGSTYQAGARGWRWVKYKKDYVEELADSLDLVIVGAWHGRGRRAGWYGALLGAAYDPAEDRYETVCKIGTGFTDEMLAELNDVLDTHTSPRCPANVACELEPDVFFEPEVVAEVRGAELSRSPVHTAGSGPEGGIALRFPRFIRWRDEKGPRDATTVDELRALYERQRGADA